MSTGTFLYDAEQSLVEVYLSIGASTLTYTRTDAGFEAALTADIALRPASQSAPAGASTAAVATERLERRYVVADTSALQPGQVFVEQVRLAAPPGEYEALAHLEGAGATSFGQIEIVADVVVPAYGDGTSTRLSSLQLATSVARATDPEDRFAKSGLRLVPNPDLFYGADRPVVPVYVEVYNPPGDSTYTLLTFLTDGSGMAPLPGTEQRQSRPVRAVDPVIQQLDIAALPSGVYYVRVAVLDAANEAVTETSARFYVINPDVARPELAMAEMTAEETLYAAMATEELEREVELATVVATGRERSQISALATDDDRRAFLVRFWTSRDTDPRPNVNGARDRFFELLRTVESRFGRGSRDGYRTDRGRVYLTYGAPSAVDRRDNEPNLLPHELWEYERIPGQGRAIFVFVDRFATGQLELVHSTVTGEVSLPNWENTILLTQ
jgi:GWxTD domain-containing protein